MRVFFLLILVTLFTSCDKIPLLKKQEIRQLDTIVDFTSVDLSPSFKICDSLIDQTKKSNCFRKTIHGKITEELLQYSLKSTDSIDEIIVLDLIINSKGSIRFDSLEISANLRSQFPNLDSLLSQSISNLPKIYPAIKRGIPVTTKYQLPIQIVIEH